MSEVQEAPQAQPRVAANVVTSENMAEFVANKLGLADSAPSEAAKAKPQESAQGQSEPDGDKEATAVEDRKQNPKLEKRFSEITKQREAARAEAQAEAPCKARTGSKVSGLGSQSKAQSASQ